MRLFLRSSMRGLLIAAIVAVASVDARLVAQELTAVREAAEPPQTVAGPVRARLGPEALIVNRGTDRIELWWSLGVDVPASGGPDWTQVPAGALLGVMRLAAPMPDIRGYTIPAGVYTLRFALQPQDGDHMGVSPYRQFLVVGPAAEDLSPDAAGYEGAVELGKKTQNRSHPAVLSIDPPSSTAAPGSIVRTEEGHSAVVVAVPAVRDGAPAGSLVFGLVLAGRIEH